MLAVFYDSVDITNNVDYNSIKGVEQLSNRSNTASFSVFDKKIVEGHRVEIREYCRLREAFAGGSIFYVDETFSYSERFYEGQQAYIDVGNDKRRIKIQSVDHNERTVTISETLDESYMTTTKLGVLKFSGLVMNAPEDEITRGNEDAILTQKINCGDYRSLFDRKVVVETYENMYFREILSRIVHKFCSVDKSTQIYDFETVATGVSGGTQELIDERIVGSYSRKLRGNGNIVAHQTISSIDLSRYNDIRFFTKTKKGEGKNINSISLRIGSTASDYYVYNIKNVGEDFEDHRGLESVEIKYPDNVIGNPQLDEVTYIAFEVDTSAIAEVYFDVLEAVDNGFTLKNCMRGSIVFDDIRVQYKKPSVIVDNLVKMQSDHRYIDNERDIHFFTKLGEDETPFNIDENSMKYGDLSVSVDIKNLRNRQTVRGGEAPDQNDYTQDEVCDGVQTSRRLDYKAKDLRIFIGSGSPIVYTEYTVGVENLVDENTVDYVYNFNEKTLRKTDGVAVPDGDIMRRVYKPYRDIRVRYQDLESVSKMKALTGGDGVYDGPAIVEPKMKTFQEARARARAEVETYKNPIVTISFKTNYDNIKPGQIIRIKDVDRGLDDDYLIQRISRSSRAGDYRQYDITASTTLFGISEFLQLLFKKSDRREVDVSELVDIVINIDETIKIEDIYTIRRSQPPYYVHSRNLFYDHTLDLTEGGSPQDAYVGYSSL